MSNKHKVIFLEYKFGDYNTRVLSDSQASEVIVAQDRFNQDRLSQINQLGLKLGISFGGCEDHICPASPQSWIYLKSKVDQAFKFKPKTIWLDHFRFAGHWETKTQNLNSIHPECKFCRGKNRTDILVQLSKKLKNRTPSSIKLGYFALPLLANERPEIMQLTGQNHKKLSSYFDFISPMLYHRMINKPVSYISQYTKYLNALTKKPIIPIIQTKDMPDDIPDGVTPKILEQEYAEAVKNPSAGVAWFSWDGAIEKHKTDIIAKIWS